MHRILLVDDNRSLLEGMGEALVDDDRTITLCATGAEATAVLAKHQFAVIVTDLKLPDVTGIELLHTAVKQNPQPIVIVITAFGTVDVAVEAMKSGAFDFVTKPFPVDELSIKVKKAIERFDLQQRVSRLERKTDVLHETVRSRFNTDSIVGDSPPMRRVKDEIEQLAESRVAVLVLGETGTGKELVARAVHERSTRAEGPFVAVNCAVFAESLLESELFGYEKGAFTGAERRKPGRFELANHGTIFLDEVGELPTSAQAKILRVLQEQQFERVGGTETIQVDVRVVAATNRDLVAEVAAGRFREDLYYRLNVVPVSLPPLRERKEDIYALVRCFIERYARENHKTVEGFSGSAMDRIMNHEWPGNVRELENAIERGVVLTREPVIDAALLPFDSPPGGFPSADDLASRVDAFERRLISEALRANTGNTTRAAEALGISRSTLRYKIEKHNLQ